MSNSRRPILWPVDCVPVDTVQLRHALPDSSWHVDWMIAMDRENMAPLLTFRLTNSLQSLQNESNAIIAERLPDHRPKYLTYEGEISDNRGSVKQIAAGQVRSLVRRADHVLVEIKWEQEQSPMLVRIEDDEENYRIELA